MQNQNNAKYRSIISNSYSIGETDITKYLKQHKTKSIIYYKCYDHSPYGFLPYNLICVQKGFGMNFLLLEHIGTNVTVSWVIFNFTYGALFGVIL